MTYFDCEFNVWRTICGPLYDNGTGARRRKFNRGLQEELKLASVNSGQPIQQLGHVMRRNEEETVRAVLEWKNPTGKRPGGRFRKR